jgi:hypothetical protein
MGKSDDQVDSSSQDMVSRSERFEETAIFAIIRRQMEDIV